MYVIWGALHGVFLVGHKQLKGIMKGKSVEEKKTPGWRVAFNVFITFNLIAFSFVFFRARSLDVVNDMATQVFTAFHPEIVPQFVTGYLLIVLAVMSGFLLHFAPQKWTRKLKNFYGAMPLVVQALILAVVIFLIIQVRSSEIVPFVYLQY